MTATLAPKVMIEEYYELRLYEMLPGRLPGFLPLMEETAIPQFAVHGIPRPLAIWQGHAGPMAPLYAYLIRWRSLDERMARWNAFYADPLWSERLGANFADGRRLRRTHVLILRPSHTWASLVDPAVTGPQSGIHELAFHNLDNDNPARGHEAIAQTDLPFLQARGGHVLGTFMTWYGGAMNQAVTVTSWKDAESWRAASVALKSDPGITRLHDASRIRRGTTLVQGSDVHLLRPLPGWEPAANFGRV